MPKGQNLDQIFRPNAAFLLCLQQIMENTNSTILARGGGGGSGGGGGGGGGGSSSSSGGSGSSSGINIYFALVYFIVLLALFVHTTYRKRKQARLQKQQQAAIMEREHLDWQGFQKEVSELFRKFEQAWTEFDLRAMKDLLSENYYKRIVLQLAVLQAEKRINVMDAVFLEEAKIIGDDNPNDNIHSLTVALTAIAQDKLVEAESNKALFIDTSRFTEYWHLIKQNNKWKLDLITQSTEDPSLIETEISAFAKTNGFYFDPDFGWLMLSNKGVLFSKSNFGKSDINNHVIGYYRDKVVEFYTYLPNSQQATKSYVVAQAILPISYHNILIKKKKLLNFPKPGLRRISLESPDFNKNFCLWAHPLDQVNSLELLTPNFMERIHNLPFELNIEIVGNFLYFYTTDRSEAHYQQMLEIISWAFDEMKM